jgi:hypothetical protein
LLSSSQAKQTNNGSGSLPDFLLLNDGLRFTSVDVPSATGAGDLVEPLDYDRNGTADFLVLNGAGATGPVQLMRLRSSG